MQSQLGPWHLERQWDGCLLDPGRLEGLGEISKSGGETVQLGLGLELSQNPDWD